MSNEYSAPPVLLFEAAGIGASVSGRRPLSAPASPRVWPGLPPLLPPPLLSPLFAGCPPLSACPADRTSKEATAPMPKSLPHRAMAPCRDAFRLLDILLLPHTASRGGGAQ